MSLNQIVKIPAEQASFGLTGADNNVDFTLVGGQVYDLSKSYVNINLRSTTDIEDPSGFRDVALSRLNVDLGTLVDGTAHAAFPLNNENSQYVPTMAALVKNAFMSSQNGGKISDLRRCDKYNFVKSYYKKSTEDHRNSTGAFTGLTFDDLVNTGSENEFHKQGVEVSRFVNHAVKIPLADVIPYCRIQNHNGVKEGDTKIHLELNLDKLKGAPSQNAALDIPPRCCGLNPGPQSRSGNPVLANETGIADYNNIVTDPTNTALMTTFLSKVQYTNKNSIPFFVGMTVRISGTHTILSSGAAAAMTGPQINNSGGTVPFIRRKIVGITSSTGTDLIKIEIDSAITDSAVAFVNGDTLSAVKMFEEPSQVSTQQVVNIELVAEVVNGGKPPSGPVVYETILSVEDNYPTSTLLNRVYEIPPMCKCFYIMFFKGGGLVSDDPNLTKYRITIDNIEQSTSSVVVGGGVYKNNIERTFMNNGEVLQCIREKNFDCFTNKNYISNANYSYQDIYGKSRNLLIAQPVQFLQRSQKLQIELEGNGNLLGRHIIYYDVVKQR